MTYYRLVASGRSDVDVSEIVLSRDADGEVEHRVTTAEATEIPEELLAEAWKVADSIGYRIAEVEVSSDDSGEPMPDVEAQQGADAEQAPDAPDTPDTPPSN